MKVLIVKLSAFGDIVHALPALDDLLARPEIDEVHWLVDSRYAFVAELFPPAVRVHAVALKGARPLRDAWQMIRKLRRQRFDLIFDLQGLIKSGLMARAIGAHVYGFDSRESPEWPNRYLARPVRFADGDRHVVQKYRRIVAAPFAASPAEAGTAIDYRPPAIRREVIASLPVAPASLPAEGNYTVLHVGGGWQTKTLPLETWRTVATRLTETGQRCLLSWGSDRERRRAEEIADDGPATVLPERFGIRQLAAMLLGASAVIGMDTGVLHLAAALGTPTVTLWGPSASWNAAPLGKEHFRVESNPQCGPCFKRYCNNFICLPSITPDAVIGGWLEVKR